MKMSFKPFRFYSSDAKSDDKITNYNKTQNIPAGYIWIDPEADYETKVIRIDPTTNIEFEEALKRTTSLTQVRFCNIDIETVEVFYNELAKKLSQK